MEHRQLLGNISAVKVGAGSNNNSSVYVTLNTIAQQFVLSHDNPSYDSIFKVLLAAGESKGRVILHVDDTTNPGVLHGIEYSFEKFKE